MIFCGRHFAGQCNPEGVKKSIWFFFTFLGVTLRTKLQEKAKRIIFIVRVRLPN
jgi:hypothetical protein